MTSNTVPEMYIDNDVKEYLESCGFKPVMMADSKHQNPAWVVAQTATDERPSRSEDWIKKTFLREFCAKRDGLCICGQQRRGSSCRNKGR